MALLFATTRPRRRAVVNAVVGVDQGATVTQVSGDYHGDIHM